VDILQSLKQHALEKILSDRGKFVQVHFLSEIRLKVHKIKFTAQ
jgi:hypothetical protein